MTNSDKAGFYRLSPLAGKLVKASYFVADAKYTC